MTGKQFAALIESTGWTGRRVAQYLGIPRSNIAAMTSGVMSVDPAIADWLRRVADAIERVPVPDLYDRRYKAPD